MGKGGTYVFDPSGKEREGNPSPRPPGPGPLPTQKEKNCSVPFPKKKTKGGAGGGGGGGEKPPRRLAPSLTGVPNPPSHNRKKGEQGKKRQPIKRSTRI